MNIWFLMLLAVTSQQQSNAKEYDAIVVGAGGGGCPLAQTLAEGGKQVLLLERGPERTSATDTKFTFGQALRNNDCIETFSSFGVQVSTGKCMGGATSFNQGIWIEEDPEWVKTEMEKLLGKGNFHDLDIIADAFRWVTERVAPEPTEETGAAKERFMSTARAMQNKFGSNVTMNLQGQPRLLEGIWRTHSIFEPGTGQRRSADTLLDRNNPNLTIRTNSAVEKVIFDVDSIPLWNWLFAFGRKPKAQCVLLINGEQECVKEGGKIFLSAGVFRTPYLLFQSGIGPVWGKVVNFEIGQHLSDKPTFGLVGFFENDFLFSGEVTLSHLAAIKIHKDSTNNHRTLLFEELASGVPSFFEGVAYERVFSPMPLRSTFISDNIVDRIDQCRVEVAQINGGSVADTCRAFLPFVDAICHASFTILGVLVADPSSTGSVHFGFGDPKVNVNYLWNAEDVEALGAGIRMGYDIITSRESASQIQHPCLDHNDESCKVSSCPDLLKKFGEDLAGIAGLLLPSYPTSSIYPFSVDTLVQQYSDNYGLGNVERFGIISPHHLAGTARVGSVLDKHFSVKGVESLYVADASALPKTPRVNSMASAMMIGRLAGVLALESGDWD